MTPPLRIHDIPNADYLAGALAKALARIVNLSEEEVRDYEQGACFFCGHASFKHDTGCSYVAGRNALIAWEAR